MSPDELAAALLEKAVAFQEGAEEQDSSSLAAIEVTRSLRAVCAWRRRSQRSAAHAAFPAGRCSNCCVASSTVRHWVRASVYGHVLC